MSYDVTFRDLFGQRAAIKQPTIPEDAPDDVREGVARRRITMATGNCPCGALMTGPNRAQRRQMTKDRTRGTATWSVDISHETDCPAIDQNLVAAITAWRGGAR